MNKKKLMLTAVVLATAFTAGTALAACGGDDPKPKKPLTDEPLSATKIVDYTSGSAEDRAETFASGSKGYSWENGEPFNVWWKPDLVTYDGGKMSLGLAEMTEKEQTWDEEQQKNVDCVAEYYGGEARTEHYYGYGDFQVRMKPAKVVGTASTFFTCTGPYDVWYEEDGETVKRKNDHDEIDIEFLGKDTTKVQFNYFASGVGGHEYMYDLGFDASLEYHDYGFRWTENDITWFVDTKPVYKVERKNIKKGESWPEDPGRIIMNYWCGTQKAASWMGKFADDYSGKAEYQYVKTSAEAQPDPNTAHIKDKPPVEIDVPETGWTDIDYSGFGGWSGYTIDKTDGLTISHDTAKTGYACEGMSLADSYSWVKFKIKNNDETNAADVRIDVKKEGGKGGVDAVKPANEKVSVNTADSAVMIKLDAGEEQEIAVKIKDMLVDQLVVFLNSMDSTSATAGSITITELKGIINGETPPPADESFVKIGDNEVSFSGSLYDITTAEDKSSMTVEYADLSGKSYANINTSIADFVADNNTFTVTIKNEGEQTAKVRIDIGCNTDDGSTQPDGTKNNFCNASAEYEGTIVASDNDYIYGGGDWVQIAAGETITAKITFTANVAKDIKFFIDSSTWDDETTHTGKVTFSDMSLSKVEVTTLPEGEGWTAIYLSAMGAYPDGDEVYSKEVSANSVTIIHDEKPVAGANLNVSPAYGANNLVHMKIKNNVNEAAKLCINVQNPGWDYRTVITSATVDGTPMDVPASGTTWDGIVVDLAANAEIILEIGVGDGAGNLCFGLNNMTDGAASGNITISEVCMKSTSQQVVVVEPEPVEGTALPEGEGWIGLDLTGLAPSIANTYAMENGNAEDNSLNTVQITHTEQMAQGTYPNVNMDVNYGTQNKLYMVITNNSDTAAAVKICVQEKTGYSNTMTSATVTRDGTAENVSGIEWGANFTVAAGETVVFECIFNPATGETLAIVLNENPDGNAAESGDITVSKVAITKTAPVED